MYLALIHGNRTLELHALIACCFDKFAEAYCTYSFFLFKEEEDSARGTNETLKISKKAYYLIRAMIDIIVFKP